MGSQISSYLLYAGLAVAALLWSAILVPKWAAASARRGGRWYLEALLLSCGPLTASLISLYPHTSGENFSGPFPVINGILNKVTIGIAIVALVMALRHPRKHAGPIIAAVAFFYFTLLLSCIAGAVPASVPDTYLVTPLILLPFLIDKSYSFEWLFGFSRVVLRALVLLSLASMAFPQIAFNLDEARTVFGIPRLQGITGHPNELAAVAVVGLLFEMSSKSRWLWKLPFLAAIILAQSSTSYVMVALAALMMTTWATRVVRALILPGLIVLGLTALVNLRLVQDWIDSILPATTGTFNGRTRIWDAVMVGFDQGPVFGYGPTLLSDAYRDAYLPNFAAASHAHNQWFQTLGGAGIVGVASLVVLCLTLLVFAYKSQRATNGLTLALILAFLIRGFSETPLRPTGMSVATLLVILTFAIIAAAPRFKAGPAGALEEAPAEPPVSTVARRSPTSAVPKLPAHSLPTL